jgi:NAD(P) transhydrogenase subunit alpha
MIRRVSPLLHTPLMSLTNAPDAIAVIGAIISVGEEKSTLSTVLGTSPSSPPPATRGRS